MFKSQRLRILIATATAGGGHLQAAAALEEAWHAFRPRDTVERIDILNFTPRLYRKAYAEGYVKLAERAPELYAHAFRTTDTLAFIKRAATVRRLTARLVTGKFLRHMKKFKPRVILCPHFLPMEAMGSVAGSMGRARPLIVCVVTDFEAHALWIEPCVDLYCVAMEETKVRLVARGIPPNRIAVTGIPVSSRFSKPLPRAAQRRAFKLKPNVPTLLVLGGGMGMGPLVETVQALDKVRHPLQVIVVAGKNPKLCETLKAQTYRWPTQVHGFVTNMQEFLAASDLIVTKPGGLTTSESLALGRPLLIINPLPGQEEANSDFLLEHGAASKVNRLEDLPYRVEQLISSKKLPALAAKAKKLGRPVAARAVCQVVMRHLGTRA